MNLNDVYITATSSFFPNEPVDNDSIENVLGAVRGKPSKSRPIVLKSNGIQTRHYAIDPITRLPTHSNVQLTGQAIQEIFKSGAIQENEVELLACGTSSPDYLMPSHAQSVQGEFKNLSCEVVSTTGVCCSSMASLKYAYLSLLSGDKTSALVTGSEASSKFMRSELFDEECSIKVEELKKNPIIAFEQDFLRWMLSDGAGAFLLQNKPSENAQSFKINWIDSRSYSNELAPCMYAGSLKDKEDRLTGWKDLYTTEAGRSNPKTPRAMNVSQDVRLLNKLGVEYIFEKPLVSIRKKRNMQPGDYSYFVSHYSSHYFKELIAQSLQKIDFPIPDEKWFTLLYEKGNVGSASIFVFLDALLKSGKCEKGQRILCHIPESARFSCFFMDLTVV